MITAVSGNKRIISIIIVLLLVAGLAWWLWPGQEPVVDELPAEKKGEFVFERLDLALRKSDSLDTESVNQLRQQFGEMFDTYVEEIISLCSADDPALAQHLNNFLRDPYIDTLFSDVQQAYASTESLEKELSAALSYFYHFFPEAPKYRMLGMVSTFQYKHALTDSGLLFGLDLHLGRDYGYYPKVKFLTNYMLPRLESTYLISDGIKLLIDDLVPAIEKERLLEEMIRAGKILYLTKKCMPLIPDSILLGFTAEQTRWAFENERSMWEYLLESNLLFSGDPKVISRLMSDGPFTPGLPDESPARMAAFTGWRIIDRFMQKKSEVTAEKLTSKSAEIILKETGYKGK